MKVIALKPHTYYGKSRKPGAEYEINKQSDLDLMVKLQNVRIQSSEPEKTTSRQNDLQQDGDLLGNQTGKPPARSRSRSYKTRNLTAEQ